jgi:hypothetical protein
MPISIRYFHAISLPSHYYFTLLPRAMPLFMFSSAAFRSF